MVRWDAPLFTVPWDERALPCADIWRALTAGGVKPPNAGTQAVPRAPSDALRALESTTAALVAALLAAPDASALEYAAGAPPVRVALPPRALALPELQRHKRAFVRAHTRAITQGAGEKGGMDWGEAAIAERFARYLEENVRP
jgi:protein KTI12